jgi:hypothetical protein
MERENLHGDAKGKGTSGADRKAESTDAPVRGGLLRSSDEASVMLVERREQAIAIWIGSTGNGRNPIVNGRRQPSCDGTSRMNREVHVRICERLGVKCPGPTRHWRRFWPVLVMSGPGATSELPHCRASSFSLSACRSATRARTDRARAQRESISRRETTLPITYGSREQQSG